jgi:putative ABC transport system permease protein
VALAGALLAACGAALLAVAGRSLILSFAGLFAIVLGLALLAPLLTVLAMAVIEPIGGRLVGTLGRFAARTVTRSVSRTGVAIAALAVAVSVTIGVGLMIQSFRSTVENWLDLSLRADIFISAPTPGGSRATPVLSPETPALVAAVPGVGEVETFRAVRVASPLGEVRLAVADARRPRDAALYRFAEGDPEEVWERVTAGAVLVSEPFAFRHRLPERGASVELLTDRGPKVFPVAGVFYDYATESGLVLISRNVYQRHWDDRAVSSLGVYVAEGHAIDDVVGDLRAALSGTALMVTSHRALRTRALEVFDRTFAVTQALRLLAIGVAFIGVWSALLALQIERTRELATLEVLGLSQGQSWGLTLLETGLMGAVAGLLSLPMGWILAFILVNVINVRSFGWTMRLEADPWLFAQALAVSIVAAVLASVYPMVRLRRRPLAAALRSE